MDSTNTLFYEAGGLRFPICETEFFKPFDEYKGAIIVVDKGKTITYERRNRVKRIVIYFKPTGSINRVTSEQRPGGMDFEPGPITTQAEVDELMEWLMTDTKYVWDPRLDRAVPA